MTEGILEQQIRQVLREIPDLPDEGRGWHYGTMNVHAMGTQEALAGGDVAFISRVHLGSAKRAWYHSAQDAGDVGSWTPRDVGQALSEVRAGILRIARDVRAVRETTETRLPHDQPRISSTWLTSLQSPKYRLRHPIPVVIEEGDEDCSVIWFEVQIAGTGESVVEALTSFESEVIELADDLLDCDDQSLGPLPRRWKSVLAGALNRP